MHPIQWIALSYQEPYECRDEVTHNMGVGGGIGIPWKSREDTPVDQYHVEVSTPQVG